MKTVFLVIGIILLVGFLALVVGPCVYFNFINKPGNDAPDMPDASKATYSFRSENTGGEILSSNYEQQGTEVGKRKFTLHGFWELRGKKFKYLPGDIVLDEKYFGEITVKKRSRQ